MPTAVRSHAKINLGLYLGAPRPDGFHSLVTVYQTLAVHDTVTVTARPAASTSIVLTSNDERVPLDSRNTAWKMVELALDALGVYAEVAIHIEKRLPVQGGLGAGSANAVAALVGLEAELSGANPLTRQPANSLPYSSLGDLPFIEPAPLRGRGTCLSADADPSAPSRFHRDHRVADWPARRLEIAAQVGSDVPLFLIGGTALGLDRGQQVSPLADIEPLWSVVAVPSLGVSTAQAFRDWDTLANAEGLTQQASTDKLKKLSRAYASAFAGAIPEGRQGAGSSGVPGVAGDLAGPEESALVRTGISSWIQNDFERVVFPQHPSLAEIKRFLAGSGKPEAALHASLSGSGSALFGLYLTQGAAEAARDRVLAGTEGVTCTLTRTLPRTDYWRQMIQPDDSVR